MVELTVGMIVASLPAARIIVVKYGPGVLEATIGSSRRTESQTLPSTNKKSLNSSNSSRWNGLGRRFKLPMLSFGGGALMMSNWRELPASQASHHDLSTSSVLPIELNSDVALDKTSGSMKAKEEEKEFIV